MKIGRLNRASFAKTARRAMFLFAFAALGTQAAMVAKVGDVGYETLGKAVTAVKTGETIVLQENVVEKDIYFTWKSFTLDLNGFSAEDASSSDRTTFYVNNGAELAIVDRSAGGGGTTSVSLINSAKGLTIGESTSANGNNLTITKNVSAVKDSIMTVYGGVFKGGISSSGNAAEYTLKVFGGRFAALPKYAAVEYPAGQTLVKGENGYVLGEAPLAYDLDAASVEISLGNGRIYTVKQTSADTKNTVCVTVPSGVEATLVLDGIKNTGAAIVLNIAEGATLFVELDGENVVGSTSCSSTAPFRKIGAGLLVIQDENGEPGSLTATVGQNAAAIGGSYKESVSNIEIKSGTITATSGQNGAAIGAGGSSYDSSTHGYVGGDASNITVSGGTLNLTGGQNGAVIGAGSNGSAENITVSGGTLTLTGGKSPLGAPSTSKNTNVTVTGGTFAPANVAAVKSFLAEGVEIDEKTGVVKHYVAKIGDMGYETLDEAIKAVRDGETIVVNAGEYKLNGSLTYTDKTFTIQAAEGAKVSFDMSAAVVLSGAKITFSGVTFDYKTNGNYIGLQHTDTLVYNDCTVNGKVFLYAASETFNRCTFNQTAVDYNVWTYGAKAVTFNGCTFKNVGKTINAYIEGNNALSEPQKIEMADCTVESSKSNKAVVNIKNKTQAYDITLTGKNEVSGIAVNETTKSAWYQVETTDSTDQSCKAVSVTEVKDDGTKDVVYVVKPYVAAFVTVTGIAGFADRKFASFAEAYAAIKPTIEKLGLVQESATADAFDALFTSVDANGNATLTYTISGTVVYDETDCANLLTMGRKASHYGNGRHLINFKFVGATGKEADTLTVNSDITLPYEWWSEKTMTGIHFENLTITGSAPSGLYPSQKFFEGIDFSVTKCALKGIKIYNCSNVKGSYTITDSVLDGTGAPANSYAIHLQGNETAPLSINIKGNTISGYDRGINIDQKTAVATIEGNTISVTDTGRSCIQLSSLATADIVGNTLELTGGNAITLHENLLKLSAAPEVSISGNKVTGTGYLIYDDAKANDKEFTSDNLKLTYATDNVVAETVDTTKGVKGSTAYITSTAVNNEVQHYVATVGTLGYPSLAAAFAALSAENHTLTLLNENAWDAATPVYWAAGTQSGYAATLTVALTAAYKANAGAITVVCRPGADVGEMTHGHVADDLTIYGNDAYLSGGECDLEVDTYTFSRATGKQAADGVCLDKDITISAYELDNLGVWGERHTANKVTVNLTDCDGKALEGKTNVQRVYISGTTGVNDITLTDCGFLTKATAVYSNADGAIKAVNCSFTGGEVPFNINHKANGTQTVAVENCTFTNCGDAGDWKQFAAPLRLVNSGTGTQSAEVTGCAFAGTVGANGDILLGDGRPGQTSNDVELKVVNTAANIQAQKPGYYGVETVDATKKATATSPASGTLETSVAKLLPVDPRTLGYATSGKAEALPATPDMNGEVVNVTAAQAQYVLDGAYGPIDGKTINFTESINDTLILGRASKYDGSKTVYRHGSHAGEALSYADFIAYKNQSGWTESCFYERMVENVTFTANEGVTVKNFEADGGAHIYAGTAPVYDYVRDTGSWVTEGSCYFKRAILKNITFKGLTFKAKTDINTSESTTVYDGFTFKDCTFDLGTTADGNQAIRYYNENNNGNVKNLVVEGCTFKACSQGVYTMQVKGITVKDSTFTQTGHNAIAIQSQGGDKGPCNHGEVVITGNTFKNIGDRIIRFNNVGQGTTVTITGNTADGNSGKLDEATGKREIVKATTLPVNAADSITASGNNWGANTVVEGVFIDDYAKLGTEACPYSREQFAAMTRADYIKAQKRLGGTLYVNVGDYAYGTDGVLGNGVRNDTPGQVPDHSKLNAYGENGYLGEKNDGANGHAVVFVGGTITSGVTGYTSIDKIGTSLLLAVPAYTKVTFKETTFKNVLSFDYQLYTSPWSQLGGLTFNGCTFDGIIVGAIAAQELAFNGCTFNNYVNTTSANSSNPTWIRPAYGNWTKGDNEGQGTDFRSLTKITFENNTVTSTRPVKFERIAQWEMATTVTATGNTFAITPQEGDKGEKKTKNVGLYFGANAKFDLVVDKNEKSGETAALYTAVYSAPTGVTYAGLPAGSTVKNAAGEAVSSEDALAWKTNDKITLKTTEEVASVTNAEGVSVNFATLADAIAAAQAGETVTLLTDVESVSVTTVVAGKDIVLDLNGKTLTSTANNGITIEATAKLTVKDSLTGGKVVATGEYSNAIENKGTLVIESGSFEAVYGAICALGGSTTTISGGTFASSTDRYGMYYWANGTALSVTVNGGLFKNSVSTAMENGKVALAVYSGSFANDLSLYCPSRDGVRYGTVLDETSGLYVYAEKGPDGYVEDESGNVTLRDAEALRLFALKVNNGNNFKGKTVTLANDIDLANTDWTPIGRQGSGMSFNGVFDGVGHTVTGLKVSVFGQSGVGFFGETFTATIRNLTVVGAITGNGCNYIGGIVGHGYATIDNCTFRGTIVGSESYQVGGIAGSGGFTITHCTVEADVSGESWVGGLIANAQDGGVFTDCYVKGTISADTVYYGVGAAGIAAIPLYATQKIAGCYSDTVVKNAGVEVNAPIIGAYNDAGITVDTQLSAYVYGNSWNKQKNTNDSYPVRDSDKEIEGKVIPRDSTLIMLEDDLNYVTGNLNDIHIMAGSPVTPDQVAALAVAQVGDAKYATLASAIAAATDGDTITLLADVTVAEQLVVEKPLTLDLGGKAVTSTYAIPANGASGADRYALLTKATVTVKNGTFVAGQARALGAYANLTLTDAAVTSELTGGHCCVAFCAAGGTYTVANATIKGDYAIANFAHNATIAITGSALEGSGCGLYHNGSYYGLKLTVSDTTINGAIDQAIGEDKDPSGVYLSGSLDVLANAENQNGAKGRHQATFTRCTIKGNTGVEVKYTDLTLEDCTVVATTKEPSYTQNNNGMAALGFAVVSTDNATGNATPKPEGTITITGADGSYTGLVGLGSLDSVKTGFADFEDAHYAVSGGTFSDAVLPEYCAAGFIPTANDDGTYGVKEGAYVAQIGSIGYETLEAALAAADAGATVKMLADVVLTEKQTIAKAVVLDLNGKTISSMVNQFITIAKGGDLTVNDATGEGRIENTTTEFWGGTILMTGGVLTVNGGTLAANTATGAYSPVIEAKSSVTINVAGGRIEANRTGSVNAIQLGQNADATLNVTGGTIFGGKIGVYSYQCTGNVSVGNRVNVSGGEIIGKSGNAVYAAAKTGLSISGGTLTPGGTAAALAIGGGSTTASSCTVTVGREGGVVGDVTIPSIDFKPGYSANMATVNLLSGIVQKFLNFDRMTVATVSQGKDKLLVGTDITACLPGSELLCQLDAASGLYEIVKLTVENAAAIVTHNGVETLYRTVQQARTAVADDDTLTLKMDYTGSLGITKKNVTIDLGGKTLTGASNSHALSFNQSAAGDNTVTVKNGTIVAKGQDAACIRATSGDAATTLTLVLGDDLTLEVGSNNWSGKVVLDKGARTASPRTAVNNGGLLVTEDGTDWIYGETETAFTHAAGTEVTLLNDWYCTDYEGAVKVPDTSAFGSAKLNLDGHTIKHYGAGAAIVMGNDAKPSEGTAAKTLEISGGTIKTFRHGAAVCGSNKTLTLDGVTLTTTGDKMYGLYANGTTSGNTVTLKNKSAVLSEKATGIYFPGAGTLTVEDSNVTGGVSGIEVRAGVLNVSGTSVIASTAMEFSFTNNDNGTTTTGAAVAAVKHTVGNDLAVTITGGTFKGPRGFYANDPNVAKPGTVTVSISGGVFSTDVEKKYLADGCKTVQQTIDGTLYYVVGPAITQIGVTLGGEKKEMPFTDAWLAANIGADASSWTTAALEEKATNGLAKWQCYLFGLDPRKEDAKVVATAGQGTDKAIPLTVANADASASPLVKGGYVTVAYVLMGSNDGTAWTQVATSDKRDGLAIPLTGTTYKFYRVDVTVTSAEGN